MKEWVLHWTSVSNEKSIRCQLSIACVLWLHQVALLCWGSHADTFNSRNGLVQVRAMLITWGKKLLRVLVWKKHQTPLKAYNCPYNYKKGVAMLLQNGDNIRDNKKPTLQHEGKMQEHEGFQRALEHCPPSLAPQPSNTPGMSNTWTPTRCKLWATACQVTQPWGHDKTTLEGHEKWWKSVHALGVCPRGGR